jgi:hypothetical protein
MDFIGRQKKTAFIILNFKLSSQKRSGKDAYIELVKTIFEKKTKVGLHGPLDGFIRRLFPMEIDGSTVLYGKLCKFTHIDGTEWINFETTEFTEFEVPANLFPNPVDIDFVVIPEAHRIAVAIGNKISPNLVLKFFKQAISLAIEQGEQFDVTLEQEKNVFKEIKEAQSVKSLEIYISYTNDDITKDAEKFMDDQLKESHIHKLEIKATPDSSGGINMNTTVIGGALKLAESNGNAKATIINKNGKRKKILTSDHPRFEEVSSNVDDERSLAKAIRDLLLRLFRIE